MKDLLAVRTECLKLMDQFEYLSRLNSHDLDDRQAVAASLAYQRAAVAFATLAGRVLVEGIEQEEEGEAEEQQPSGEEPEEV